MTIDKTFINPDNIEYRKGVGLMIMNAERKIWVGQRQDVSSLIDSVSAWQMPQGGIDSAETPWQAALREMKEEIGTINVRLVAESREWISYDFPEELHNLWGGRFLGQTQKWFLVEFLGDDAEININTFHPEFIAWKWVDANQLPNMIVSFKKDLYQKVLEEFKGYL